MRQPIQKTQLVAIFRQGAGDFVTATLLASVQARCGMAEANRLKERLRFVSGEMRRLRQGAQTTRIVVDDLPCRFDPALPVVDLIAASFALSVDAFASFKSGDFAAASGKLDAAHAIDTDVIGRCKIGALFGHLIQSRHNLSRLKLAQGEAAEAETVCRQAINSVIHFTVVPDDDAAVVCELMGHQLLSYYVENVLADQFEDQSHSWQTFPRDVVGWHTAMNAQLWRAVRAGDRMRAEKILTNGAIVFFSALKNPTRALFTSA